MNNRTTPLKVVIASLTAVLLLVWITLNINDFLLSQNGTIRFLLGTIFALLILFRPKPTSVTTQPYSNIPVFLCSGAGAVLALTGIVMGVHQLEWLGILLLVLGCLKWILPPSYSRDTVLSLILLYWIHPLPTQIFGPLQFTMQKLSVAISEWLLHMFNIRVWADGMVLRTGLRTFEIPEWCSGMRTATTVFLLSIGLGILKRIRWHECVLITIAAVVQALILNVLRISIMVTLAPLVGSGSNIKFLHDTSGLLVASAVLLVWVELTALQKWKQKRIAAALEFNRVYIKQVTGHPPFWRILFQNKAVISIGFLLLLLTLGLTFKSRPYHRAEMIKDVTATLRDSGDLESAERAAEVVSRLVPDDSEWILTVTRILLMRGKYDQVLANIDLIPTGDEDRLMEILILKAYSFMGLSRIEEANNLMSFIPEDRKEEDPRVAMIMAELGVHSGNMDQVVKYIVKAREWLPNTARIRRLYPYLHNFKKWDAISQSDTGAAHTRLEAALFAADAAMNLNNTASLAAIVIDACQSWPVEPRLLVPLLFLAINREDDKWEARFADHLKNCIANMQDPDTLYKLFANCFQISRPDLAWAIYNRIREIDPEHPALYMSAVNYGDAWFTFRSRYLGISAMQAEDTTNIKPALLAVRCFPNWAQSVYRFPLFNELCLADTIPSRKKLLDMALLEFKKRDNMGTLSMEMGYEYVRALELAGNTEAAREQLKKYSKGSDSERSTDILAQMFERSGDWQNAYETLRDLDPGGNETNNVPSLSSTQLFPLLRLCAAQRQLRLGFAALHTANYTVQLYPDSVRAIEMLASTLLEFDSPEEALSVLNRPRSFQHRTLDILKLRALYMTQRFREAERFSQSILLAPPELPAGTSQSILLPPAELSLLYHLVSTPSEIEFKAHAEALKKNLVSTTNPFMKDLITMWLKEYSDGGTDNTRPVAKAAAWSDIGRNNVEKALALHQLAMLLCRERQYSTALRAIDTAIVLLPDSSILHRLMISLSSANPDVIKSARKSCPFDSELWLAELVSMTQKKSTSYNINPAELHNYSAAALTRAAEYLLRVGRKEEAVIVAREAVSNAEGLLPAYTIGLRCALSDRNRDFALNSTRLAIAASVQPVPAFFKKLITIKMDGKIDTDSEMINALSNLREKDPDNPLWAEMLGYVYFSRDTDSIIDSMYHMIDALGKGSNSPIAYQIAAESSRRLGNPDRAADILRRGRKEHPDDIAMLNNLVFTLAQSPKTLKEASELSRLLMKKENKDPGVLDTIAVVLKNSGELEKSEQILSFIIKNHPPASAPWFRANTHIADIALRRGYTSMAQTLLNDILDKCQNLPSDDILAAGRLLEKCNELVEEEKKSEQ